MEDVKAKSPAAEGGIFADLSEALRSEAERIANEVVKAEFDEHMGYGKNRAAPESQTDRRNGCYTRKFLTRFGEIEISVPRDREGSFQTTVFPRYSRKSEQVADIVVKMYESGCGVREIAELLEIAYGESVSPSSVSRIAKRLDEDVSGFGKSRLPERVFALFLDGTYVPLRRDTVEKECVVFALAITADGGRTIAGFSVVPNESASAYRELLSSLKERGLEKPGIAVSDGLNGLPEAIAESYPGVPMQRCCVHLMRNLASKVRKSGQKAVSGDFMAIAKKADLAEAEEALASFSEEWGKKYPSLPKWIESVRKPMLAFYSFPEPLRKLIYTSNAIESVNRLFKSEMGRARQFPGEDSLERRIVAVIMRYNSKARKVRGWEAVIDYMDGGK